MVKMSFTGLPRSMPEPFDRYKVLGVLVTDTRGAVYEAIDPRNGSRLVMRVVQLATSVSVLRRWSSRSRTPPVVDLRHPNIVAMLARKREGDFEFIATDYVEGESLARHLERVARLPVLQGLALVAQMLAALKFAHARGQVHGAVQPKHLLICRTGQLKIAGFGWAAEGAQAPVPGRIHVPLYSAPEQGRGAPADALSDLYSAALVARWILGGGAPGASGERAVTLPSSLAAVFERALSVQPQSRYPDAAALCAALQRAVGEPVWERPGPLPQAAISSALVSATAPITAVQIMRDFAVPEVNEPLHSDVHVARATQSEAALQDLQRSPLSAASHQSGPNALELPREDMGAEQEVSRLEMRQSESFAAMENDKVDASPSQLPPDERGCVPIAPVCAASRYKSDVPTTNEGEELPATVPAPEASEPEPIVSASPSTKAEPPQAPIPTVNETGQPELIAAVEDGKVDASPPQLPPDETPCLPTGSVSATVRYKYDALTADEGGEPPANVPAPEASENKPIVSASPLMEAEPPQAPITTANETGHPELIAAMEDGKVHASPPRFPPDEMSCLSTGSVSAAVSCKHDVLTTDEGGELPANGPASEAAENKSIAPAPLSMEAEPPEAPPTRVNEPGQVRTPHQCLSGDALAAIEQKAEGRPAEATSKASLVPTAEPPPQEQFASIVPGMRAAAHRRQSPGAVNTPRTRRWRSLTLAAAAAVLVAGTMLGLHQPASKPIGQVATASKPVYVIIDEPREELGPVAAQQFDVRNPARPTAPSSAQQNDAPQRAHTDGRERGRAVSAERSAGRTESNVVNSAKAVRGNGSTVSVAQSRRQEATRVALHRDVDVGCRQDQMLTREVCKAIRCASSEFHRHPVCIRRMADQRLMSAGRELHGGN